MPKPGNHSSQTQVLEHDDSGGVYRKRVSTYGWNPHTLQPVKNAVDSSGANYVRASDSPSIDAFGRWRTSNPETLFDSKQIHNNQPLFWDDQAVSGTGTSSTHSVNRASSIISVSATTAGKRVRQTFQRFNYQPGKSQLIFLTMADFVTTSGITKEFGYFDDKNGIFFRSKDGTVSACIKTYITGSAVDTVVSQSSWNIDTMDGNGPSGVTIDFSKAQIGIIDFEWLGVGRVRVGWVVDGIVYYCHQFLNANSLSGVYMSTPNLPVRYSIENSGSGAASTFEHVCSSVISEAGQEKNGILRHKDSGAISNLASGTAYAAIGIKLKAANLDATVLLENLSIINTTINDQAHWELRFNPAVAGTFTYTDQTNSVVQIAIGSVSNTVTGGTEIDGGYFATGTPVTPTIPNALRLGSSIAGVADTIVLCVIPITNNMGTQASLTWRELS